MEVVSEHAEHATADRGQEPAPGGAHGAYWQTVPLQAPLQQKVASVCAHMPGAPVPPQQSPPTSSAGWSQQSLAFAAGISSITQQSWVVEEQVSPHVEQNMASIEQSSPGAHAAAAHTVPSQVLLQQKFGSFIAQLPGAPAPPQQAPSTSSAGWSQQSAAPAAGISSIAQHFWVVAEQVSPHVEQNMASVEHSSPGAHAAAAHTVPSQVLLQQKFGSFIAQFPGAPAPPQQAPSTRSAGWSQQSAAAAAGISSSAQHVWVVLEQENPQVLQNMASRAQDAPAAQASGAHTVPSHAPLQQKFGSFMAQLPGAPPPPQQAPSKSSAGWSQQSAAAAAGISSSAQHVWVVLEQENPQVLQNMSSSAQDAPAAHASGAHTVPSQAPLQQRFGSFMAQLPGAPPPPQQAPSTSSAGWSQQSDADTDDCKSSTQQSCVVVEHVSPQVPQYMSLSAHDTPAPHGAGAHTVPSQAPLQHPVASPVAHCPAAPAPPQQAPAFS